MNAEQELNILPERVLTAGDTAIEQMIPLLETGDAFTATVSVVRIGNQLVVGLGDREKTSHLSVANEATRDLIGQDVVEKVYDSYPPTLNYLVECTIEGVIVDFDPRNNSFRITGKSKDFGDFNKIKFKDHAHEVIKRFFLKLVDEITSDWEWEEG